MIKNVEHPHTALPNFYSRSKYYCDPLAVWQGRSGRLYTLVRTVACCTRSSPLHATVLSALEASCCQQPSGMTLQSMPCEPCISRLGGVIALQQASLSVQLASSSLCSKLSMLIFSIFNMRNYTSCDLPQIQYIHYSDSVCLMR